jgi:hypothetical protein
VKASSADDPFCAIMFRHDLYTTPDSLLHERPYVRGCPLHFGGGGGGGAKLNTERQVHGQTYRARKTAPQHARNDVMMRLVTQLR